jgi:hypothetical protein
MGAALQIRSLLGGVGGAEQFNEIVKAEGELKPETKM